MECLVECLRECQNRCQIEWQMECQNMSGYMSDRASWWGSLEEIYSIRDIRWLVVISCVQSLLVTLFLFLS